MSELTIDDLTYISYPCPCISGSLGVGATGGASDDGAVPLAGAQGDDSGLAHQKFSMTMFNVIIAMISKRAMKEVDLETHFSSSADASTVGRPVEAMLGLETKFYDVKISVVKSVIETFSKGLLLHELTSRYVSGQVKLLLRMTESFHKKGPAADGASGSADGSDVGGGGGESSSPPQTEHGAPSGCGSDKELMLMDLMLQSSSLSNELRLLFHCLVGGSMVNLTINNSLTMKTPLCDMAALDHASNSSDMAADLDKGLLLLSDPHELADLLAALDTYAPPPYSGSSSKDASSTYFAKDFLFKCAPTKRLRDVAIELNEPYSEVLCFASQLVMWSLARFANIVTKESVFRVNPTKEGLCVGSLEYRIVSPIQRLLAGQSVNGDACRLILFIVSLFDGRVSLDEAINSRFPAQVKPYALDILVVLLRCGVLLEVGQGE